MLSWIKAHKIWSAVIAYVIFALATPSEWWEEEKEATKNQSEKTEQTDTSKVTTTTEAPYVNSYDCEENLSIREMLLDDIDEATSGVFQSDAKVERSNRQLAAWRAEALANGC